MSALIKIAAASALMMSAVAQAVPLVFKVTGGYTATWTMDSNPTPDDFGIGAGIVFWDVSGTYPGAVLPFADITFYAGANDGGMEILDYYGDNYLMVTDGPQIYSGTETAPVFRTGSWAMTEYLGTTAYTLTISNPVPEPATVASMLAGLGMMGVVLRRRKARATAEA